MSVGCLGFQLQPLSPSETLQKLYQIAKLFPDLFPGFAFDTPQNQPKAGQLGAGRWPGAARAVVTRSAGIGLVRIGQVVGLVRIGQVTAR